MAAIRSPGPATPAAAADSQLAVAVASADTASLADLPLIERPPDGEGDHTLVILLTGDGGWANADERVAAGLHARGAAVVGVNLRAYLSRARTPEETARDIERVAHHYLDFWRCQRLLLLGYSRGADLAPFIASRWPEELRSRLNLIALVSLSARANFHFHWIDLVRDVDRPDDLPVTTELAKLRGLRVICVYGKDERDSACRDADSTIVTRYARDGGHRITGGYDAIAELLEAGLSPIR